MELPAAAEEIRTLYITGFPLDVKERELDLLFRKCPGYEGSSLRLTPRPVAFASFVDQASALAAMQDVQGVVFDRCVSGTELVVNLAKHNTKTRRPAAAAADGLGSSPEAKRQAVTHLPTFPAYVQSYPAAYAQTGFPVSSEAYYA
eukprot:RCo037257